MAHAHTLVVQRDGSEALTVLIDGTLHPVRDDHPRYETIKRAVTSEWHTRSDELLDLIDQSASIAEKFETVTERVSVAHGRVYFDGDELDNSLTRHLLRQREQGVEDYVPFARFLENIAANPSDHSREHLYDWLRAHKFTITEDGCFLAYKGVTHNSRDGETPPWESCTSGPAGGIVNGVRYPANTALPQGPGDAVSQPRSTVQHAPDDACATGLHIGTFEYARDFGPVHIVVKVNPRDVVSVPSASWKARVCRYEVVGLAEETPDDRAVATEPEVEEAVALCFRCGEEVDQDGDLCDACEEEEYEAACDESEFTCDDPYCEEHS